MKKILLTLCLFSSSLGFSQGDDTISIMYYNLLKFPDINSARIAYLETVTHHVLPDILVVCELTSGSGSNSILNNALNTQGINYYQGATWVDGPDTENMLYYNSNKLGFISQSIIPTSLRDINEYILYYKEPGMSAATDTTYLYIYGLHLKAGNSGSDATQRDGQATTLKSYLNTRTYAENTMVGGDFNIYTSTEGAYGKMTASNQANLYDPIGPGNYHNNSLYVEHFTQSTRTDQFDGGSTGGMDDRFDMILFSDDMLDGQKGARFIPSSYRAIGQDGISGRWNSSLISPTNNSEPSNVINALYYMSDHLPVYMEFEVGGDLSVDKLSNIDSYIHVFPNPADDQVNIHMTQGQVEQYELIDMQGRLVASGTKSSAVNTAGFQSGVYILYIQSTIGQTTRKVIIE